MASNYSSFCSLGFTLRAARLLLENPRGRTNWRTRHKSRLPIFICLRPSPPIFEQKRDWSCRQSMACSIRQAFYAYIETCTLFFHTYHVFFSLNINLRICCELKRHPLTLTFLYGLMPVWRCTRIFKILFATRKKKTAILNFFLFSSKVNRFNQTAVKLRLELPKRFLFSFLWPTVVKFAINS